MTLFLYSLFVVVFGICSVRYFYCGREGKNMNLRVPAWIAIGVVALALLLALAIPTAMITSEESRSLYVSLAVPLSTMLYALLFYVLIARGVFATTEMLDRRRDVVDGSPHRRPGAFTKEMRHLQESILVVIHHNELLLERHLRRDQIADMQADDCAARQLPPAFEQVSKVDCPNEPTQELSTTPAAANTAPQPLQPSNHVPPREECVTVHKSMLSDVPTEPSQGERAPTAGDNPIASHNPIECALFQQPTPHDQSHEPIAETRPLPVPRPRCPAVYIFIPIMRADTYECRLKYTFSF